MRRLFVLVLFSCESFSSCDFERGGRARGLWDGVDFSDFTKDCIEIIGLGLVSQIGVPEEERAVAQRLEVDVTLWPVSGLGGLGDEIAGTVNYAEVAVACRAEALRCERRLIETLAEDFCRLLLGRWGLARVRVRVSKFILPDTRAVCVTLTREAADFR